MPPGRFVLTDELYNVSIAGNITGRRHREFAMASGEMTEAELLAFKRVLLSIYVLSSFLAVFSLTRSCSKSA
jgi:hypothetical protein